MFGMGIFEILVILIVAVIFLGPEKLPQAMVDVVKFFKAVKKTLNDAKDTFDKELHMSEIKKEALEYRNTFESSVDNITKDIQLKEIDDMFGKYKEENQTTKPKRTKKTPKIPAPDAALSYEDTLPKKRGRKPKTENQKQNITDKPIATQTKKSPIKPSVPKPISQDSERSKRRVVTPKATKSVGFKKSTKTSKEG
ncbi:Sec-independent protein translocase protein TatB [Helicobacter cappadocius]|uniref:Sec-independent protein translocase protein TatB homolog n=1 Tax=Helicobacter cappadocius TaxID=3063998 RepID=A0AA90TFF6_9HELI|nr:MULTISPECIES: Sec-independent protein translocase protein TatB [unclassified Helicobacter]MDO7253657.1 Sec-independent protein translocase protein TatB [Helicobacter sp. faydin-H75]MDP2539585.1 Sec-independent protein translocase protein TatB [Helicobacter sp. faydin-H76]